jgi:Lrp/AsnC family leucine-responsive transcriptional regulator
MVAGGFDYLVKVRVPDMAAYREFLGEVLSKVSGIRETHSYAVMERVKESAAVDLSHMNAG